MCSTAPSLTWTWPYRPEIVAETFTRIGERWLSAVSDLRFAIADSQKEPGRGLERDIGVMEAAALHFEAIGLMICYYLMRNAGSSATTEYRTNVERQLQNAERHLRVCRSDSRIGYEAQTGYMYTPLDVREKIAACRYQLKFCNERIRAGCLASKATGEGRPPGPGRRWFTRHLGNKINNLVRQQNQSVL